ncbi:hypothetical protein [Pseudomonas monteilii]|uniref:hypothetical protein n=1 Tax=Pseudomonas monteilii TaxID=76759 RepID=UPI001E51F1CC|nr:hypothetical protein [Pseudomonas monteilii]WJR46327.1 hypothetical protein LU654_006855 [Pseudomonas monteilii]
MTSPSTPPQVLQQRAGSTIVSGSWPDFTAFRHLPEADRWKAYECAKRLRSEMEAKGFVMSESYDAFVRRVTEELEL